jgi:hypothetical protein
MNCPTCEHKINYKVERKRQIDLHCRCGFVWAGISRYKADDLNILYGEWDLTEISRVLRATAYYCDDNLRFWKGRKVFTCWMDGMEKRLISRRTLAALLSEL